MTRVTRLASIKSFKAEVETFLLHREAEHCLLIGLIDLMLGDNKELGQPLFYILQDGSNIIGAAMRTGENRALILSEMPEEALPKLVQKLKDDQILLPEINGPANLSSRFAEVWLQQKGLGQPPRLLMSLGLFKLERVKLQPSALGFWRLAKDSDAPLLLDWLKDFEDEAA